MVLREFPTDWRERASITTYDNLTLTVPCPQDLIAAKMKRNEPRDQAHKAYAESLGLM